MTGAVAEDDGTGTTTTDDGREDAEVFEADEWIEPTISEPYEAVVEVEEVGTAEGG